MLRWPEFLTGMVNMVFGCGAVWVLAWVTAGAAEAAPVAPSVAVLKLEAKNGVAPDLADLLTTNLIATLRKTKRFDKVVSSQEVEGLVGFERQKQLLSCESQSCIAEIAGALGVEYVVIGSVGRVGQSWLLNASLVNTRTQKAEGSVSSQLKGQNEEVMLAAMPDVVEELLKDSAVAKAGAAKPADPGKPMAVPVVGEGEGGGGGVVGKVLLGAGAGGVGLAGLGFLAGVVGAVAAGGLWLVFLFSMNELTGTNLGLPLSVAYLGAWVVSVAGGVLWVALTTVGLGTLAAGFVLK